MASRADVARRTCANVTWHARPRGRAAHGPHEAQVAHGWSRHVAGGHASPHERLGGTTW